MKPVVYTERDIRRMSDDEFYALANIVLTEQSKRNFLRSCYDEVRERVAAYERYASKEAKDLKSLADGAIIGPGEVVGVDGVFYENISGGWLNPFTAGPTNFLAGWKIYEEQK